MNLDICRMLHIKIIGANQMVLIETIQPRKNEESKLILVTVMSLN